ncbi:hypothetical protein GRS96_12500 [Rathayibacter sp. VKM Ac-2803]|uniref:ParB/RepB/Spo0J family partition protein n=1 Tax=Rathayibacter sp. VKM Ac-2803 TaxID=2609256 RepID=UPI0013580074|nr:ParB N-terminal domain-containing protein [Rathayibacter sp. VKM Ac-2803]MWV50089.1 hypothetical protein [Rathayibacter sp. VKM Ac-2803]
MPTTIDARVVPIGKLTIAANVRTDTRVDKPFVSNIKQHGILVPITVVINDVGGFDVIDGQRRTLAAIEAGLDDVPVIVARHDTSRTFEITDRERIIEQLVVNDHRAALTDAEHTAAWQQLSLFGVSADQISRKVNAPKKRVESALAVAGSAAAATAIVHHQLTIDQALVITAFDGDDTAIARLDQIAAEHPEQLEHEAARIREEQAEEAKRIEAIAQAGALGVIVLEEAPTYTDTVWQHRSYIYSSKTGYDHPTPEQLVAEAPDDVAVVVTKLYYRSEYSLEYYVRNWNDHGWFVRNTNVKEPLTDAEKEQRRISRDNTKLWRPATDVRRAWIRELLQRRTVPIKGDEYAALYVASTVGSSTVPFKHAEMVFELLGIEDVADSVNNASYAGYQSRGKRLQQEATHLRYQHVLLGIALAATEAKQDFEKTGWKDDSTPAYLAQLSRWGYTLSEIEEQLVNDAAARAAAEAPAADDSDDEDDL